MQKQKPKSKKTRGCVYHILRKFYCGKNMTYEKNAYTKKMWIYETQHMHIMCLPPGFGAGGMTALYCLVNWSAKLI